MSSPLQRTKKEQIETLGRSCDVVERFVYNRGHGYRSDLFGLFDLVSMNPGEGIIGIQCCAADFSAHYKKITIEKRDKALEWLDSDGKIELWSWRKLKVKRGGKAVRWTPRIVKITREDFYDTGTVGDDQTFQSR